MAILFDWYENPQSSEQQGEENALHPRLRLNGKMSTAQLRARIQKRCTLTETDVIAVLDALSHAMGEELADGKQVHLDGIGFFRQPGEHRAGDGKDEVQEYEGKTEGDCLPTRSSFVG
jgi:predicted histone-like DNA-binding protein